VSLRACIVGAGPSGFYTADQLLKAGFEVDLLDALPTPFGLVRFGVAPDHPKIKSVIRVYEKVARREGFRFFGGIELGRDVSREDLLSRYHVLVYAVGTSDDNRLGIPGEDRPGSWAATRFVAWYNGHPDAADEEFDLSCPRVVVVGNGNVALDVARMILLHPEELAPTDTADHAIDAFGAAAVEEVVVLGRRGPAQAAFTNPEVRELVDLQRAGVVVDATAAELDPLSARWLEEEGDATAKRNVEMLQAYAAAAPQEHHTHALQLRFLASPVEILGEGEHGRVTGVRIVHNRIEQGEDGRLRAVSTGEEEVIECGAVVRSIGYRGRPLPGVAFDERRGLIRNQGGRVCSPEGEPLPGEYAVGWIKRGPSGVIGTNKKDAADTVARVVEDAEAGLLAGERPPAEETAAWLLDSAELVVEWEGWQAIDLHEQALGEPHGRPRVKLVRLAELTDIVRAARADA
jgi:ferredoxin/flavodoxin---NADP+ reductase